MTQVEKARCTLSATYMLLVASIVLLCVLPSVKLCVSAAILALCCGIQRRILADMVERELAQVRVRIRCR